LDTFGDLKGERLRLEGILMETNTKT